MFYILHGVGEEVQAERIRKGTMELPQVWVNNVPGDVTPVKQTRPRINRLGQPISTLIHRYRVPRKKPTTDIPASVIGSGAGRMKRKTSQIATNTAASIFHLLFSFFS